MRVVGYACLNTMSQQPKNFTLEDQQRIIQDFVKSNGWKLVDIYQEVTDTSTAQNQQPKLLQIIAESDKRNFDVLVIARLDRLTRNIRQLNTLISQMCMKNGVELISIDEGLDTRNQCGELALKIIDIITKWDTKRISDRTREIIARKRAKGERVGHAPFGYTYSNKKLIAVDSELKTVALIREQRDNGYSYHKIAKYLNERKIPSKRGGIWYAETVKTVYQNALHGRHRPDEPSAPAGVGM
ncbi:MAG: recombinase family protein [SAR324 cluster bacterium]|nr:recombinase family protein [SAR324 cluster bacterium]